MLLGLAASKLNFET